MFKLNQIFGAILLFIGVSQVHATTYPVKLGDQTVFLQCEQHGTGKAFIHLHQNERTALKAAYAVIKSEGGSVLTLKHHGRRNVVFHLNRVKYEFDPNRIFSDIGIRKTLKQFGHYSPEAHALVAKLANAIKARLPDTKIIAVHNNEAYSLRDYYPGKESASDARALHINRDHFYRNFYLVTQQDDYLRLSTLKFNSVWQASRPTDDGSLSVYLSDKRYVNVEAGYDQLATQIRMLRQA